MSLITTVADGPEEESVITHTYSIKTLMGIKTEDHRFGPFSEQEMLVAIRDHESSLDQIFGPQNWKRLD